METDSFKDKVVVITGGGGVLCGVLAKAIAYHGAKVAILDLNESAAVKLAKEITTQGGIAMGVKANVLNKESLEGAKKQVTDTFGDCDILINGAGGNHPDGTTTNTQFNPGDETKSDLKTFFDLTPKGIQFVSDLNFMGTFLPTQIFTKDMLGKSGCAVLNISSMNAYRPLTKIPAYSAAKAAVSNFTQWLAVHLAPMGVRVNAIAPGFFVTDQNRSLLLDEKQNLTQRGKTIIEHTPMGRFGKAEDLIGSSLWLLGNDSEFVTGTIIPIDGGFSAFSGV